MARSRSGLRRRSRAQLARLSTERPHPRGEQLDQLSTREIVSLLADENAQAAAAVRASTARIAELADLAAEAIAAGGRVIYVGAGTSGRLGALDAAEIPPTFGAHPRQLTAIIAGGHKALRRSVEGAEDDGTAGARALRKLGVGPKDLVVGIAASSATPFVTGALLQARAARARRGLICCNPAAAPKGLAQVVVALATGPEILAGSTRLKAGTATKIALNALSTAAMVRLGRVYRGRMVDIRPTSEKLRARAERTVADLGGVGQAQARALLAETGSVRLALAMALTGLGRAAAARALQEAGGLRALEEG